MSSSAYNHYDTPSNHGRIGLRAGSRSSQHVSQSTHYPQQVIQPPSEFNHFDRSYNRNLVELWGGSQPSQQASQSTSNDSQQATQSTTDDSPQSSQATTDSSPVSSQSTPYYEESQVTSVWMEDDDGINSSQEGIESSVPQNPNLPHSSTFINTNLPPSGSQPFITSSYSDVSDEPSSRPPSRTPTPTTPSSLSTTRPLLSRSVTSPLSSLPRRFTLGGDVSSPETLVGYPAGDHEHGCDCDDEGGGSQQSYNLSASQEQPSQSSQISDFLTPILRPPEESLDILLQTLATCSSAFPSGPTAMDCDNNLCAARYREHESRFQLLEKILRDALRAIKEDIKDRRR